MNRQRPSNDDSALTAAAVAAALIMLTPLRRGQVLAPAAAPPEL